MIILRIVLLLSTAVALIPKVPRTMKLNIVHRTTTPFATLEGDAIVKTEPQEMFWITPEGLSIEVLAKESSLVIQKQPVNERIYGSVVRFLKKMTNNEEQPVKSEEKPPILFIHGSFHGAWCFAENYLDYFSELGHDTFAVSLRGTSITGMPPQDPGEIVRIEQHVSDIRSSLASLKSSMSDRAGGMDTPDPIIVAHSFGGLILMKLLEDEEIRRRISGACLLCSVPPSGNGPMIQRFIKSKFLSSLKIVWGFVFKGVSIDLQSCRELFFDKSVPSKDIEKYMTHFRADSRVGLDLQSLDAQLPSSTSTGPEGRAEWLPSPAMASPPAMIVLEEDPFMEADTGVRIDMDCCTIGMPRTTIPCTVIAAAVRPACLVIGAEKDFIVDRDGVSETARYLGVKPVFIPEAYHDVMLGPKWRLSADIIADWLATI